ncbi:hypothetical protein P3T76_004471 [Phytophthora citrophthora]|uniref:Uncharacterized protein n=1 Tax=Phytophthora citrophthora TaxID=4793 RepID=A0AAD9LRX2_9STRA|nr:hypothetical protein P3T76_004471 [Phytophthora citrophthora]
MQLIPQTRRSVLAICDEAGTSSYLYPLPTDWSEYPIKSVPGGLVNPAVIFCEPCSTSVYEIHEKDEKGSSCAAGNALREF